MEKKNRIYVFVGFLFVLSALVFFINFRLSMTGNVVLEQVSVPLTLTVSNSTGFNITEGALSFGKISKGSDGFRTFTLENRYDFPVKYIFSVEGNIKDFIATDKEIILQPGEIKEIGVVAMVREGDVFGDYSGRIIIDVKRSFN